MSIADECFEGKLLDKESGVLYTATASVWPVPSFNDESLSFCGNIFLDSGKSTSSVEYKLRVVTKVKYKGKVRCANGQGLLEPNSYHQIRIKIMEKAIEETELQLVLNEKKIRISVKKSEEGMRVYGDTKEEQTFRWQMIDADLLKSLPIGVTECIKDGQQHNVRKQIFEVVYPLVLEMLENLGQRSPQLLSTNYFDIWEKADDPINSMVKYVLFLLKKRSNETEKVKLIQK